MLNLHDGKSFPNNIGRKHTKETKEKIGSSNKNPSDETRQKRSKSLKGHIVTNQTREKIRNTLKGISLEDRFGKEKANQIKKKIGIKGKGRKLSEKRLNQMKKK